MISRQQNNLSVAGGLAAFERNCDSAIRSIRLGFVHWSHRSDPKYSTVLTGGSNWLASNNTNGSVGLTRGFSTAHSLVSRDPRASPIAPKLLQTYQGSEEVSRCTG